MSKLIVNAVWIDNDIKLVPHATLDRWYKIADPINIILKLDDLRWIIYNISNYFWFDGRSGGRIPDLLEPNIGSQLDVVDWLIHDINAYAQYFSYSDSNEILKQMRSMTVSNFRAWYIKRAVSTSRGWYGEPKKSDREYINMIGNNGDITFSVTQHYIPPKLSTYKLLKGNKH